MRPVKLCTPGIEMPAASTSTGKIRLYLAFLLAVGSAAHADVIFEEPTQITCGRSEIIVGGTVEGTTTAGPFTNGHPATVQLTANNLLNFL